MLPHTKISFALIMVNYYPINEHNTIIIIIIILCGTL